MATFAVVIWESPQATLKVGDVVEVDDEEQTLRVQVRDLHTRELSRVFAEHLAWIPPGIASDDPRLLRLAARLPGLLVDCAFSLEAQDLAAGVVREAFPPGGSES